MGMTLTTNSRIQAKRGAEVTCPSLKANKASHRELMPSARRCASLMECPKLPWGRSCCSDYFIGEMQRLREGKRGFLEVTEQGSND